MTGLFCGLLGSAAETSAGSQTSLLPALSLRNRHPEECYNLHACRAPNRPVQTGCSVTPSLSHVILHGFTAASLQFIATLCGRRTREPPSGYWADSTTGTGLHKESPAPKGGPLHLGSPSSLSLPRSHFLSYVICQFAWL